MSTDFSPSHGAEVCWQVPVDFRLCHVPEVPVVPQVPEVPPTRNSLLATFVLQSAKKLL